MMLYISCRLLIFVEVVFDGNDQMKMMEPGIILGNYETIKMFCQKVKMEINTNSERMNMRTFSFPLISMIRKI